ncbi:MAG: site-specific integrase [Thermoanaerobaculia bacterium]
MQDHQLLGPQASSSKSRPQAKSETASSPLLTDADRDLLANLSDHLADFLERAEHVDGHSRFTVALYRQAWTNFRRFLVDRGACADVAVAAKLPLLDRWVGWNHKRGIQPITANSSWRSLRPFFNYLETVHGLANAYRSARAPRFQMPDPKALKPEQIRRVLAAARNYDWRTPYQRARALALVGVMLFAGLRKGEVLRLEFADLDLEDGTIHVLKGKGRHGGKPRTAYMIRDLLPILRAYLGERRRRNYNPPELFATGPGSGLSDSQFRRIMRVVRDASGIAFTPHSLRHSYITTLIRNRVPLHGVQAFAGHADLQTTQRYVRLFDDDLQGYIRKVRLQ